MLKEAKAKLRKLNKNTNIHFIRCDAENVIKEIPDKLDSILYNASIFLIPNPEKALKNSYDILKIGGTIGVNYLFGLYSIPELNDRAEPNLFQVMKKNGELFAPYGRRIFDVNELPQTLRDVGFKNICQGLLSIEMNINELKAFYSIPAQSAALWPKSHYDDRLELFQSTLEYFSKNKIKKFYQHWGWCTAEK
jgi:ubiquinone/menaquinone biosynthesis C-methylase UbiE